MRLSRRFVLTLAALAAAVQFVHADNYPSRRITLIAPWPAAGAIDTLCRQLAPGLADRLGQPVIVENRPGAGSTIGTADVAKAQPDGYVLVMAGSGSLAISPTLYKKLPYDPRQDFSPIAMIAEIPFVLVVNPSLPIGSAKELIKYATEHPGALTYASGGAGSPHQLYAELFKSMTGIQMTHVPYKGNSPALTDVIAGHVDLMFADATVVPMVRAGKLRALGVSSLNRLPSAPEIPPIAEVGVPGFNAAGWGMIVAPAHTPAAVVTKLHDAISAIEAQPEIREHIIALGLTPKLGTPPDQLQDFINTEMVRWGKVVQSAGLAGSQD